MAILDFQSERFQLPSFESTGLLVQEKKRNIDFRKQDRGHLRFPIRTISATVDLQVTSILPMNFQSIALLVQEKKFKFQDGRHGRHLRFPIRTI